MHDSAQWWFVIIKPSAETKTAVQPEMRAVARRTLSSHCGVTETPYFALTLAAGKLSKVYIPSSAKAGADARAVARQSDMAHARVLVLSETSRVSGVNSCC